MITSNQEFEEAVLFELLALETFAGTGESTTPDTLDLTDPDGGIKHHQVVSISTSQSAVEEFKKKVLPLAFGAGWKVLDQMIEHELIRSSYTTSGRDFKIAEKQRHARTRSINGSSLSCQPATWDSILDLYANTVEHRHCLVHRTAKVDEVSGELNGIDRSTSKPLIALTRAQQYAFAKCAAQVARGIIDGGISSRNESDLKYHLNQLTAHLGAPDLPDAAVASSARIMINFENDGKGYLIDMSTTLLRARSVLPSITYFDVIIRNPIESKRIFLGQAEVMPTQKKYVDLSSIPSWLVEQ